MLRGSEPEMGEYGSGEVGRGEGEVGSSGWCLGRLQGCGPEDWRVLSRGCREGSWWGMKSSGLAVVEALRVLRRLY